MDANRFAIVGFDLDGTLLDTHGDLTAALNHALAGIGRAPLSDEETRLMIGGGAGTMFERALARTGGPVGPEELARLREAMVRFYADNVAVRTRPFPGSVALLDALAEAGVGLALVTNKVEALALRLLDTLELRDRFFTVLGGDSLGPGRAKPAPDLLQEMMRRGAEQGFAGRTAYVGDTSYDVGAARAAGIPCVVVRFGYNDFPPDTLGGDAVIDDFAALPGVLARL